MVSGDFSLDAVDFYPGIFFYNVSKMIGRKFQDIGRIQTIWVEILM